MITAIAICFGQFGPYHHARVAALQRARREHEVGRMERRDAETIKAVKRAGVCVNRPTPQPKVSRGLYGELARNENVTGGCGKFLASGVLSRLFVSLYF